MSEERHTPLPEILEALGAEENLPIHLLYQLSDLGGEDLAYFEDWWPQVPEERRRVIARHLADISEENYLVNFVPVFISFMHDQAASVRVAALDGIWDTTDTTVIEPIIDLMQNDESFEVRAAAAAALAPIVLMAEWGQLPESVLSRVVPALIDEHERPDSVIAVKRSTLEALGGASHQRVPELIVRAYEHYDPDMQLSAVFAMGGSADPRWLSAVMEEMESSSVEMRTEAARAAGSIGDESAVPGLVNLMIDEDIGVALAAIGALAEIGGERASRALRQIADDPEFEALHEAVDEALDEIAWQSGMSFDLLSLTTEDEFEDD